MTFDEAKEMALAQYSRFNRCTETEHAFIFDDDDYDGEGGIGATLVISKENGRMMPFHVALTQGLTSNEIREIALT